MVQQINAVFRRIPVWAIYLIGFLPLSWAIYQLFTDGLGEDPVKALEHRFGKLALQLLLIGLAITPLRRITKINLLKFRRALGLLAFLYVSAHFAVWLWLDVQLLTQIQTDILKRPFITIGVVSFLLMLPLALTSNNLAVRRLGRSWHRLHQLVYLAVVLGGLHFVWQAKGFQWEPWLYFCTTILLLLLRLVPQIVKRRADS